MLFTPFLLFALASKAQLPIQAMPASNLRIKTVPVSADSLQLEQTSIIPGTFFITGIDTSFYRVDYIKAFLYWKIKPQLDTVILNYRVFPFRLTSMVQRLSFDSVLNNVFM